MARTIQSEILLLRAGFILLAFFVIALLWAVSEAFLPEGILGGAIRGTVSFALFYLAWDFSMQLGDPGGLLHRAPREKGQADQQDQALWAELFAMVDGPENRRQAIDIRLSAKRLQRESEEERALENKGVRKVFAMLNRFIAQF